MAVMEYQKNGKTVFKVYVQIRGRKIKRIRLQKVLYDIESRVVALKEEKRLIKELAGDLAKQEGRGLEWGEVIDRWETSFRNQKSLIVSKKSKNQNEFSVANHVNRLKTYTRDWLRKTASELTKNDGIDILNKCTSRDVSLSLLKKIQSSIGVVYTWGLEQGFIQYSTATFKSPVDGLEIGSTDEKIPPILTLHEVRQFLLEAMIRKHPWFFIWAFAVITGMRSGELMALEWSDIDENIGIIRVSKSYNRRTKAIKTPKNGEWRNVDISPQLMLLLKELRVERGNEKYVLPRLADWMYGNAAKVLRAFLNEIGLNKYIKFHTLRACFATHLLAMGVEAAKVMSMGGWKDFKTFQIYIRLAGIDVRGVTSQFNILPEKDSFQNVVPLFS